MNKLAPRAILRSLLRDAILRRMFKNVSFLLSGTAGASALGLVTLALTARALGPELLGIFALIQAYTRLVDRLRLECWPALIKYGADALEDESRERFKSLIKFGLLLDISTSILAALGAAGVVLVAGAWFDWTAETTHMAGLFSIVILFRMSSMPIAVMRLFNRFGLDAALDIASAALRLLLVAIAYVMGAGLWGFVLITMATQITGSVVMIGVGWAILRREGYRGILSSSCKGITQRCPGIWSFIWSLNAGNLASKSTRELDTLIVGGVVDPAAVSIYHIAKRLGEVMLLAGIPIQQAVYPDVARLWARGEVERFRQTVMRINLGAGALAVSGLVAVAFYGDLLIKLTVGSEYLAAANLLVLQTVGVSLFLFGVALRPALFSMGLQMRFLQIVTLSTTCFYVVLLLAVPTIGLYGAPIAHIAYNVVWLVAMQAAVAQGIRQASVPGHAAPV
jgi:O-antigen/teichoic acid export membrane protein